jgi:hypothetical protein
VLILNIYFDDCVSRYMNRYNLNYCVLFFSIEPAVQILSCEVKGPNEVDIRLLPRRGSMAYSILSMPYWDFIHTVSPTSQNSVQVCIANV